MSKPVVFVARFYVVVHAPVDGYEAVWEEVLDEPSALVVCDTGVRCFGKRVPAMVRRLIADGDADRMPIRRIDDQDIFTAAEVREQLADRVANRQGAAFAAQVGVARTFIGAILRGERSVGGRVLEALGLLRIPQSDLYMRMQDDIDPWRSDLRGGVGGTELYYS